MIFTDIHSSVTRSIYARVVPWYGAPTNLKLPHNDQGFLLAASQGIGTIKSGAKVVKDDKGKPVPYAKIFCYLQSKTRLELVAQTTSDVNGIWEIKGLNKSKLYTVVASYSGFENTTHSNVYPI